MTREEKSATPAEVWHPGVYLLEEMEARGWSVRDVAERMGGQELVINELLVEQIIGETYMLPNDAECELDPETAAKLARAFGTSAEFWLNLDRYYREAGSATVRHRHRNRSMT